MLHNGDVSVTQRRTSEAALFLPTNVKTSLARKMLSHRMTRMNSKKQKEPKNLRMWRFGMERSAERPGTLWSPGLQTGEEPGVSATARELAHD